MTGTAQNSRREAAYLVLDDNGLAAGVGDQNVNVVSFPLYPGSVQSKSVLLCLVDTNSPEKKLQILFRACWCLLILQQGCQEPGVQRAEV